MTRRSWGLCLLVGFGILWLNTTEKPIKIKVTPTAAETQQHDDDNDTSKESEWCYRWVPDLETVTVRDIALYLQLYHSGGEAPFGDWFKQHPTDSLGKHVVREKC